MRFVRKGISPPSQHSQSCHLSKYITGVCAGRFDAIFDWLKVRRDGEHLTYNTYFFRDNKYWMYENRKNRTRFVSEVICQWHFVSRVTKCPFKCIKSLQCYDLIRTTLLATLQIHNAQANNNGFLIILHFMM